MLTSLDPGVLWQANENKEVEAQVLRRGSSLSLKLTPHSWGGRGLLGCHLRPL